MKKLSSLDYARIIMMYVEQNFKHGLNKTQMNKLLYICYGVYLARTGKLLFEDDKPQAWPFGPVFPRVNKRFNSSQGLIEFLDDESFEEFKNDDEKTDVFEKVLKRFHGMSAGALSIWSHKEDGPWYSTVFKHESGCASWGREMKCEDIAEYFKSIIIES